MFTPLQASRPVSADKSAQLCAIIMHRTDEDDCGRPTKNWFIPDRIPYTQYRAIARTVFSEPFGNFAAHSFKVAGHRITTVSGSMQDSIAVPPQAWSCGIPLPEYVLDAVVNRERHISARVIREWVKASSIAQTVSTSRAAVFMRNIRIGFAIAHGLTFEQTLCYRDRQTHKLIIGWTTREAAQGARLDRRYATLAELDAESEHSYLRNAGYPFDDWLVDPANPSDSTRGSTQLHSIQS